MSRKVLAFALCVLMLVGIVPMTAFAAEVVEEISITEIVAPVAGMTPDYTCREDSTAYDNGYTTNENLDDMVYTRFGKTWFDYDTGKALKATDTFVAGHRYGIDIFVAAKPDYSFKTANLHGAVYVKATGSVNGNVATVGVHGENAPGKYLKLTYVFEACPNQQITDVAFPDIKVPVAGEKPNYISSKDSTAHGGGYTSYENLDDSQYTVYGKTWRDVDNDYTAISKDDVFEAGHTYAIDIYVCPVNNYEFKSFSAINATVNRNTATVSKVADYDYNEVVCIRYIFPECTGDAITGFNVNIDVPVAGQSLDYTASIDGEHLGLGDAHNPVYAKNGVMWHNVLDDKTIPVGSGAAVAEAEGVYRVGIIVEPDEGYSISRDAVITLNGEPADVVFHDNGSVTLTKIFELKAKEEDKEDEKPVYTNPFTDVDDGKWYTEGILWCYHNGYMAGLSDTVFGRKSNVNRAMFVTILAQIDKADTSSYTEMSFSDVPAGQWYSNAIEWAYRNGYAAGIGGGLFGRKADVSREQIALFFYTYAEANSIDVSASVDLSDYTDYNRIHDWALKGVEWAVAEGLIAGVGEKTLAPRDSATRQEIALIVKNFVENIISAKALPLVVIKHPESYYMSSSQETADFSVEIAGGKAPYSYTWVVVTDSFENSFAENQSSDKVDGASREFTDYDFDDVQYGITVYCRITDANGTTVKTDEADVFPKEVAASLTVVKQPEDFYMSFSQETADFSVEIAGGKAPYTYKWYVVTDSFENSFAENQSSDKVDGASREFTDYDFDDVQYGITVYCRITDANGTTVKTDEADVFPK